MLQTEMSVRPHHAASSVKTRQAVSAVCVMQASLWPMTVCGVKVRHTLNSDGL